MATPAFCTKKPRPFGRGFLLALAFFALSTAQAAQNDFPADKIELSPQKSELPADKIAPATENTENDELPADKNDVSPCSALQTEVPDFIAAPSDLIAACQADRDVAAVPLDRAQVAQNMLRILREEWFAFGQQSIEIEDGMLKMSRVGVWEDDTEWHSERVLDYWRVLGRVHLTRKTLCTQPWSAVFMSWVMREAGVPSYVFPARAAHWQYLMHFLSEEGEDDDFPFKVHAIADFSPRVGDLICALRGNHANEMLLPHQLARRPMHCDFVLEKGADFVWALGGNVYNSVSRWRVPLDENGKVLREKGGRPWVFVVENRYF